MSVSYLYLHLEFSPSSESECNFDSKNSCLYFSLSHSIFSPTLFLIIFVPCSGLAHQRTVSGPVEDGVVPCSLGCAERFVPGLASYLWLGREISAVYLFEHFCQVAEIASDIHHPNLLPHSCR